MDVNDNEGVSGFNAVLPDSARFRAGVPHHRRRTGRRQGRSSGGQVSLVTKSGSNQFHGSLYEYMRNTLTAANSWFNNRAGVARTPLVRNQYGASIGGRIIRDRAFFFFNWEDRKDRSGASVTRTVPSETYKQGIVGVALNNGTTAQLTAADIAAVDPLHVGINNYMLSQFKQYPAGNDPKAAADGGLNFSVLRFNAPSKLDNRAYVAKMDFNLDRAGKHTLSLRGTLADNANDSTPRPVPRPGARRPRASITRAASRRGTPP